MTLFSLEFYIPELENKVEMYSNSLGSQSSFTVSKICMCIKSDEDDMYEGDEQ